MQKIAAVDEQEAGGDRLHASQVAHARRVLDPISTVTREP